MDPTSSVPLDFGGPLSSTVHPLHDVQNVMSSDEMVAASGALRPAPLSILQPLFYERERTPLRSATPIRRESTQPVLDSHLPSPVAGPSRTASQRRLWQALERMNSDLGSEFGGSDAVIYGGSERGEGSFMYDDQEEPESDGEEEDWRSVEVEDVEMDDDEEGLSDLSESVSEDEEDSADEEGSGSDEEGSCCEVRFVLWLFVWLDG